jgi:hypothetical protein
MSLTSYRAAPPRDNRFPGLTPGICVLPVLGLLGCGRAGLDSPRCCCRFCGVLFGMAPRFKEKMFILAFCRPGSDLLSRVLRRSTIGAGAFHGRVRNGNGCSHPARTTRSAKRKICAGGANCFREAGEAIASFFEHVFCVLSGCFQQPAEPSRRLSGAPSAALSRVRTDKVAMLIYDEHEQWERSSRSND